MSVSLDITSKLSAMQNGNGRFISWQGTLSGDASAGSATFNCKFGSSIQGYLAITDFFIQSTGAITDFFSLYTLAGAYDEAGLNWTNGQNELAKGACVDQGISGYYGKAIIFPYPVYLGHIGGTAFTSALVLVLNPNTAGKAYTLGVRGLLFDTPLNYGKIN